VLPIEDTVIQFAVLVFAALVAQLTVERAHLPGLLGLLLLGLLLGPAGLGVLPREPIVEFLGHVGLVYVMFLAGLEIDLDVAREHSAEALSFGSLGFILCALPGVSAALLLGYPTGTAVMIGVLISSHTLLAFPIVQRLGLLRRTAVVTAVAGTLLTDTLALAVLAIMIALAGVDNGVTAAARPLLLLVLVTALSLLAAPHLSRVIFRQSWITPAEKALFALVVLMILASATELIGTDMVLGAFLAGLVLNRALAARETLREHIEFVGRMLFIPFFFVYTGMLLDLEAGMAGGMLTLAAVLVALVVLGKSAAAWLVGARFGYSRLERMLMIGLTVPQAAATLAVTLTAQEIGLVDDIVVDAVVLVIFATCLAGPLLAAAAGRRLRDEEPATAGDESRESPMDRQLEEVSTPPRERHAQRDRTDP
jgi:Kef-type K+ transport system membrane component KefB